MNRYFSIPGILAAGLLNPGVSPAQQQEAGEPPTAVETSSGPREKGMLPVHPRELVPALPKKPKKWEMIQSTGETTFGEWLESRVIRKFERIDDNEPEKKERTRVVIVDTAKQPDSLAIFSEFKAGEPESFEKEEEDYTQKIIDSWPAIVIDFEEEGIDIELLVHGRYLIQFTLENQAEESVHQWLERLDLNILKAIPETPAVSLPERVNVVKFDQLDPGNNLAYRLATTSGARLDRELEEDAEWVRQALGDIPKIDSESAPAPE